MRSFNTTGPVMPADHYCVPPLGRLNLNEVLGLIRDKKYFVLHAPRQTGKTSALLALRDLLNSDPEGAYRCVYANVEVGQAGREDTQRAMRAILSQLALRARQALGDEWVEEVWFGILQRSGPDDALQQVLSRWAAADPTPLVLLIDEIDSLVGDTLVSVLRQLRAGYDMRPAGFPQSVVLCGVRDVRDYRIEREYGLGRRRTDLLLFWLWPQGSQTRRFVVECKILHKSWAQTLAEGLEQTAAYMDRCAAEVGHLVVFDRGEGPWAEKVFHRCESAPNGLAIHVWGM